MTLWIKGRKERRGKEASEILKIKEKFWFPHFFFFFLTYIQELSVLLQSPQKPLLSSPPDWRVPRMLPCTFPAMPHTLLLPVYFHHRLKSLKMRVGKPMKRKETKRNETKRKQKKEGKKERKKERERERKRISGKWNEERICWKEGDSYEKTQGKRGLFFQKKKKEKKKRKKKKRRAGTIIWYSPSFQIRESSNLSQNTCLNASLLSLSLSVPSHPVQSRV